MKQIKKLLSYVIVVVMVFNACIITANADTLYTEATPFITAKVVDDKIVATIFAEGDMSLFDFGVAYDKDQVTVEKIDWDVTWFMEYSRYNGVATSGDKEEQEYVVIMGATYSCFEYDGAVATITFAPKEGVSVVDSLQVFTDAATIMTDSNADTLAESGAVPVAKCSDIKLETDSDETGDDKSDDSEKETVALNIKANDRKLTAVLSVNANLLSFDYGIAYNANQITVDEFSWDADFQTAYEKQYGMLDAGNKNEEQYVVVGGICVGEEFKYNGPIATITFTVKDDVTDVDSIMVIKDSESVMKETGAKTLKEVGAAPVVQTGIIAIAVPEEPDKDIVIEQNPDGDTTTEQKPSDDSTTTEKPDVDVTPEQTPDKEVTSEQISNEDGTVTDKVTEKETSSDGTTTEKVTETTVGNDGTTTEKIEETITNADGSTTTTNKETVTNPDGTVTEKEETVTQTSDELISILKELLQVTKDVYECLTVVEKELADGTKLIKEITEQSNVDADGNVVTSTQVKDEIVDQEGVSQESFEYSTSSLPQDVQWTVETVENSTVSDQALQAIEKVSDGEYVTYDITPEVDGEKVQVSDGSVKVSIYVGDAWSGKTVSVYDLENNVWLEAQVVGEYVVFYAQHFSQYTVSAVVNYTLGNIDNTGNVELTDAQLALRMALLLVDNPTKQETLAADVDENGAVELADAQQILRRALLLMDEFEKA